MAFDLSTASPVSSGGFDLSTAKPASAQRVNYREFAREEAKRQGVPEDLVLKVIGTESNWDPNAVSPKGSIGLMQLQPGTAKDLKVDPYDPKQNIAGGIKYLKQNLNEFGSQDLALIAYNAGPGNARKYGRGIPFPETQGYLDKILGKKGTLQVGPFDTGVELSRPVEAGIASAGGATLDAINGVKSLFGFGDNEQDVLSRKETEQKLSEEQFWPSLTGSVLANAGMMYTGGNALRGAGAAVSFAPKVSQALTATGNVLASPMSWKDAAVGSGLYGIATNGEDRKGNALAAMVGGPVGYLVGKGAGAVASGTVSKVKDFVNKLRPVTAQDIDNLITSRFGTVEFASMPQQVQDALRTMAKRAVDAGDEANFTPEMVQRAADFKRAGVDSPLKGWLTRDPMDWVEAHSLKGVDDGVTNAYQNADLALVGKVQGMAPDASDYAVGSKLRDTVAGKDAELKSGVDAAYQGFREITGRDVPLDPVKFNNEVGMALQTEMLGSKVPADVTSWFSKIADGSEPFNFHTAAQRLERINKLYGASRDPQERMALGLVKKHLESALSGADDPVVAGVGAQGKVDELSTSFQNARNLASQRFKFQETSPLHESIISGDFTPEKLPEIIKRVKVDDIAKIAEMDAKMGTNAIGDLRDAAAILIRDGAIKQQETGGKFTVAGLRRAMDQIGPENGRALFGDQWIELESVLRAGGSIMNQPAGVVANNSGTSHALARLAKAIPIFPGSGKVATVLNLANRVVAPIQDSSRSVAQVRGYDPSGQSLFQRIGQEAAGPTNALAEMGYLSGSYPSNYLRRRLEAGR